MSKLLAVFLLALTVGLFANVAGAGAVTYPAGFEERTIATGIDQPTDIAWTPDGRMLITEKGGVLKVVPAGGSVASPILDISSRVNENGDRGLIGVAVDSSYASNRFIYLLYTYDVYMLSPDQWTPAVGRLERYTLSPTNQLSAPTVVLGSFTGTSCADRDGCSPCPPADNTLDCIPSDYTSHTVGTVRSAPDGTLWVGSGDGASFNSVNPKAFRTYDERSMAGKVMHIDRNGRGLPGHPFCPTDANMDHVCTKVFAKGFRNPFRFTLRPNGGLVVGDVGWGSREEIDVIDPSEGGRNWGWPCYEGTIHTPGYEDDPKCKQEYAREGTASAISMPDHDYAHGAQAAVVAGPQYTGGSYPATYDNKVFFGDFPQAKLWMATLDSSNRIASVQEFSPDWSGTAIEQAPNGNLVYTAFDWAGETSIKEIAHTQSNRTPVAGAIGTPTSGKAPLTVAFNGSSSRDPDNDPLSYDWNFGDASAHSTAVSPSHTYSTAGSYTATLTVRDNRGASASATVPITAGNDVPVATIVEPAEGGLFTDGQPITLRGSATDPQDGTLPGSAISWRIAVHHVDHVHPATSFTGSTVTFATPDDHDSDSYLEVQMTARDSGGLTAQKAIKIYPRTVNLAIRSTPAGVPISYSGAAAAPAPFDRTSAIGYRTTITAPAEYTGPDGRRYEFARWSNGGGRLNDFTVPATASTLTAEYSEVSATGLVGAWSFDEGAGASASDASGLGNDGALSKATWDSSGRYGAALSFNGADSWVTVPDAGSLDLSGPMTLEAWVKPRAAKTDWRTVLLKESADDTLTYGLYGAGPDGGPSGWARDAGAGGAPPLTPGEWSHVAFTYDGSVARLYVNGGLVRTTPGMAQVPPSDRPLRIGGNAMWPTEFWDGLIDEVRVWDVARHEEQVAVDMSTPITRVALPDTTAPSVLLTAPEAGATLRGTVDVAADASDGRGVASVQFRLDGNDLGAPDSQAPYTIPWDSTIGADGTHVLSAVATDGAGNTATAAARTVTVANDDTTAPSVRVTGPAEGTTLGGTVELAADARDDRGVASLQFRVDGEDFGDPIATPPYSASWETRDESNGEHKVTAVAVDAAGNERTSAPVTVTVDNADFVQPVGEWGFDEASGGVVLDSSENGNDGAIAGASRTASGRFGGALSFDGRNDWVTIPDSSSLDLRTAMTLEAWVKPRTAQPGWRSVLVKEAPGARLAYALYGASLDGTPSGRARNASAWGTSRVPTRAWTHLAYTYDGTVSRLYVNGSLVSTAAGRDSVPSSDRPLRIGGNAMWSDEFWNGMIDDVRVYDVPLDAAQIAADMWTPAGGGVSDDTSAPAVRLTAPAAQAELAGTVALAASAADDQGVASVQFRVDGADVGSADTSAPYTGRWDTRTTPGGRHQVTAIARDAAGNTSASTAVAVVVDNGATPRPVGAWSFDERSGTAVRDSSGRGNDGTVSGATWVYSGRRGGALSFDGRSDWVTIPDASSLDLRTGMTLEAWVKPRTVQSDWKAILLKEDASPSLAYALYGSSSSGAPSGWARDAAAWGTAPLRTVGWTHLAYTYNGSESRLYANGSLVATTVASAGVPNSSQPLRIGGNAMWSNEFWDGLIDEVRVYDEPLTAAQVGADMNAGIGLAPKHGGAKERRTTRRRPRRSRGAGHPARTLTKKVVRRCAKPAARSTKRCGDRARG